MTNMNTILRQSFIFAFLLIMFCIAIPGVGHATNHYTFEHAEEMRLSGRIDWQDYGPAVFSQAIEENKPIFLVLTAPSWCYWCHVYTSDSYIYNEEIYPTINDQFIPVYVDADKRQDLTREFLEGGWPSTTVMAPNGDRLYGFSGPRPIANMKANLLEAVNFVNTSGFSNSVSYQYEKTESVIPTQASLEQVLRFYDQFTRANFDEVYGGFGDGQKFPQARALDYFLDQYEETGDQWYIEAVEKTLTNQITTPEGIVDDYNLYDPLDGGFHRYGTTREWTPPHYEKMLYDNARLLNVYHHLLQLRGDNTQAQEVVRGTDAFIQEQWRDTENGGFYGNTDVHGEDAYFGQNPRPLDKPRVEKTKYTDWNAEAILTYLRLYQDTQNEIYKESAEEALQFFGQNMIDASGSYHYYKDDGDRGVRGMLLDNAYILLALSRGYEVLEDETYLIQAQQIADYMIANLYDWYGGGFFERNSPDKELYGPGQQISLTKPSEENGLAVLAMLRLSSQTQDTQKSDTYLHIGLTSLGAIQSVAIGSDQDYYGAQSAAYALQNNLLEKYQKRSQQTLALVENARGQFWVNDLIVDNAASTEEFIVSEEGLEKLEGPFVLLLLIAFGAGFLSFLSPCTLPVIPAFIAYTFGSRGKKLVWQTLAFFGGLSLVFIALGMSASFFGAVLKENITLFSQIAGIVLILFGLYIISGKGFRGFTFKNSKKPTTYFGSFVFGGIFGLSWTPCIGPILVSLLLLASIADSMFMGGVLLFAYALGLSLPLIILAFYADRVDKKGRLWKILAGRDLTINIGSKTFTAHSTSLISGIIFAILGYLIFSGTLYTFNELVGTSSFQKWIFGLEDYLIDLVR